MPRTTVIIILSIVVWGACRISPSLAQNESLLDRFRTRVQDKAVDLAKSRAVLESKASAEWTAEEIQAYLLDSLWTITYGLNLYEENNNRMPDELSDMSGTEYIPVWPGNPFADWAPMDVLGVTDGFKAGDLVLQVCPPEFYSRINNPIPLSFELGIYGENIAFAGLGNAEPSKYNTWATTPEGVYAMVGAYTETAAHMRKKWARRKQQQKDEDIQN
jgi:hypothetical protein